MRHHSRLWLATAVLTPLVMIACSSAPTHVYPLTPARSAVRLTSPVTLRIDAVHVPPDWDRIEIVSPGSDGGLMINDLDRWSAPLAQATRQMLTADLESLLPEGSVIYPHLAKSHGALGVSVDILAVAIGDSQGSMQASWIITPVAAPETARRNVATVNSAVASVEPAAIARAWSVLLGQIAERIAADATAFPTSR